ncbi:MAG TPA: glutamate formimidoyltransferase [Thermoanaerobaculia bacterium]|nr:glutamate formimidoyltransferase [Thermoanaerobaculia bacterium]
MALLECVPNVSEGRDQARLDRLVAAAAVEGVRPLDRSSDPDHHRAVLTWVGEAAPLIEAACRLCHRALDEIDLRTHRGAHPRLGAVDVVPFVPLLGTPMALAVETARAAGAAIAERCGLPVMLYEAAASDPTRRDLARHRRGGLAALSARMTNGEWPPDFGPSTPHPTAGVVCVGARVPLVAFNVLLDTAEVETAREIARRIRAATPGGLSGVKAIGLYLESRGCAQVSVNLVDCQRTTLGALVRRVRDEARALGARVSTTELVGLAPLGSVLDAAAAELLLPGLEERQILESRLLDPNETPHEPPSARSSRRGRSSKEPDDMTTSTSPGRAVSSAMRKTSS